MNNYFDHLILRLLFFVCLFMGVELARGQQIDVKERALSNGMKLLMLERNHSPTIAGGWVVRVGSVNERPGITGISHLFEHMMFKGTPTIGTNDAKRDAEIINEQEICLLYTSPSPRDGLLSRMPSSA